MIKILINNSDGNGDVDYTNYVIPSSIQIQQSINVPTNCSFSIIGTDSSFKVPIHHAYVKIYSGAYKRYIFTGFLVTDPAIQFIGLSQQVPNTQFQMYQYNLSCTSDDYMLNIKSVPFIPAFTNKTQGQILQALAEILMPGYFNYTNIADGDLVPYLAYDPTQSWYEYAKQFGDGSRYRYYCINKEIHYQPYGDGNLGIQYDTTAGEGTFDPSAFQSTPLTTPLVNDVTMIGMEEGGNNREDHFIGTGFDGGFGLKHKVYGLSSNFQGSSMLLQDNWNSNTLNTQNWFAQDPAGQFNYSDGALNIASGFELPPSMSVIYANNVLELAGAVVAQHGEIQFNDASTGIIGGFYQDSTMAVSGCIAGFQVTPGPTVDLSISGASGIEMAPMYNGVALTGAYVVTSQINKTYTMFTRTSTPLPVRYQQIFRSLAGSVYGGYTTSPTVTGSITMSITETDIGTGAFNTWQFTITGAVLPDTCVYGLINNQQLNITLNSTEVWTPPPASLHIGCEIGASPLGQFYLSGNVQYTGAFITPSGGNLPIEFIGQEQQFDLGSGIGNQAGEIDSGQQFDTLNFYSNDLPAPGARIRLQTWESQVAVSRMQSQASITGEAVIVGDDGIRATTISNLNPLPRTSEDCDNAAAAFLEDRSITYYQGSYNAPYYFFNQYTNDLEFFPVCGRFLYVNAPNLNLNKQNMLVTSITTTFQELASEIAYYNINFGPDTYVEKVLSSILPQNPAVFQPTDTAIQPTPQELAQLGTNYLPDIFQSNVLSNSMISGAQFSLALQDNLVSGGLYEIRSADWNWGQDDGYFIARYSENQVLTMPRTQYDQTWFIRQVANVGTPQLQTSRRTKCVRIVYPRIPTAPVILTADTANVNMDLSGDTRNIEGLEIRQSDDKTVCYQTLVGTRVDTFIDMDLLRNQLLPGEQGLTGLGKVLVMPFASGSNIGSLGISGVQLTEDNNGNFYAILTFNSNAPALIANQTYSIAGMTSYKDMIGGTFTALGQALSGSTPIIPAANQAVLQLPFIPSVFPYGPAADTGTAVVTPTSFFNSRLLCAHFFNLMWEYSPVLSVYMPPFSAPTIEPAYRWGSQVQINFTPSPSDANRTDFNYTHMQIASDRLFANIQQDIEQAGNIGSVSTTVPVTGDIYVRGQFIDHVGSGAWSNTLYVPQGDLIASDYLASQGSVPPAIIGNPALTSGGIIYYTAIANTLQLYSIAFNVWFPNGALVAAPSTSGTFLSALDVTGALDYSTSYGFFPSLKDPLSSVGCHIEFNGPYFNYSGVSQTIALTGMYEDGSVPLFNSSFVVQTSSPTGSGGGGGGGSGGAGGCGILTSKIQMARKGHIKELKDLTVTELVSTPNGFAYVDKIEEYETDICSFLTESGLSGIASTSHTLCMNDRWIQIAELKELMEEEDVFVWTDRHKKDRLIHVEELDKALVRKIYLKPAPGMKEVEHYYNLDGFWCHNKNGPYVPSQDAPP